MADAGLIAGEPGLRAGGRRRLCRAVRGAGRPVLPVPKDFSDVEAASLPETFFTVWSNVFERGRAAAGRDAAGAGRHQRHRRDGDPARQGARRDGHRHGRQRREVRRLPGARRRPCDQLPQRRTSPPRPSGSPAARGVDVVLDMVAGDYVAREVDCLAEDGRIVIIAVQGGTRRGVRRRPGAAPAPDHHRLDAAAAPGRVQDGDRRRAARARSGRCSRPAASSR